MFSLTYFNPSLVNSKNNNRISKFDLNLSNKCDRNLVGQSLVLGQSAKKGKKFSVVIICKQTLDVQLQTNCGLVHCSQNIVVSAQRASKTSQFKAALAEQLLLVIGTKYFMDFLIQ